jgi:hypothetical protein
MNNQKDLLALLATLRTVVKQINALGNAAPEGDKPMLRKMFANVVLMGTEVRNYAGLPKKGE